MKSKAQAGLEYLMTYGWAVVLIATVIGTMVFIIYGNVGTEACPSFNSFICKGISTEGNQIKLVLQNKSGQKITINPGTDIAFNEAYGLAEITHAGQAYISELVTIGAGEEFSITAMAGISSGKISIYYRTQAGLTILEEAYFLTEGVEGTVIGECGYAIEEPGTYLLEGSITGTESKCVEIKSDNVTIDCQNNTITGAGTYGIYAMDYTNLTVVNCKISDKSFGILVVASSPVTATVSNNATSSNTFTGIYLYQHENSTITNNTINNNGQTGLQLNNISNSTIKFNTINENTQTGIALSNIETTTISNNTISSNQNGLKVSGVFNNGAISNNIVELNKNNGMHLSNTQNNSINNNTINSNENHGIYLEASQDNTFSSNTINQNMENGFYITNSGDTTLNNNNICNNQAISGDLQCAEPIAKITTTGTGNVTSNNVNCPNVNYTPC